MITHRVVWKSYELWQILELLVLPKNNKKINLVKQMKIRIPKVSDHSFHQKNLRIVYNLFIENSYRPLYFNIFYTSDFPISYNNSSYYISTNPYYYNTNNINFSNFNYHKVLINSSNTFDHSFDNSLYIIFLNLNANLIDITSNNRNIISKKTEIFLSKISLDHVLSVSLPQLSENHSILNLILADIPNLKIGSTTVLTTNKLFFKLKCEDAVSFFSNMVIKSHANNCDKVYRSN